MGESLLAGSAFYPFSFLGVGEGAALLAAFLWAAATLMFGRLGQRLSPLVLNIAKGLCAITMMLLTLGIQFATVGWPSLPFRSVMYLAISGALGIGLGDTAYFSAINALGARRALLLETLAPPMVAILAWVFLAEKLSLEAITGIVITLLGIAWVISERVPGEIRQATSAGVRVSLLATFCQAAGAVLSRAALAETTVSPLWSSVIRLFAGLVFMSALALSRSEYLEPSSVSAPNPSKYANGPKLSDSDVEVRPTASSVFPTARSIPAKMIVRTRWQQTMVSLRSPRLLASVAAAAFFATYLGIWLQQIALKHTATGIAQALLATSPLFVIPMVAILGEKLSWRAVLGVAVSLGGVWLLLFAK